MTTPKPPPGDLLHYCDPAELNIGPRRTFRLSGEELAAARRLANEVVGSSEPGPAVARFVHEHVRPTYGLSRYKRGPLAVLESGRGDCLEAHLVAALLLRSLGVPCRFISEVAAARFEIGQALCALLRKSAAGPWTNTHVWTEMWDGEAWQPLDTTFGVYGRNDWVSARLCPDGTDFGGFRFPLQIRSRDADGTVQGDLSEPYLLEPFAGQQDSAAFRQWAADVAHFARLRREGPYLGARLLFQGARFRRMTRNLKVLLAVHAERRAPG
ncbi:MAG: transglutaminase domain-containing protein [Dehalococcoidia bacterium]|nr:transglutaminase domain-containing protein [Dehalococcoidia bacterium]